MGVYTVEVGVALARPPRTDEYRVYSIAAASGDEAELIAQQIASCTSVMATESVVTDWPTENSGTAERVPPLALVHAD